MHPGWWRGLVDATEGDPLDEYDPVIMVVSELVLADCMDRSVFVLLVTVDRVDGE